MFLARSLIRSGRLACCRKPTFEVCINISAKGHRQTFHHPLPACMLPASDFRLRTPECRTWREGHTFPPCSSREETMTRVLTILAAGIGLFAGLAIPAQAADVSLARLDCGTPL